MRYRGRGMLSANAAVRLRSVAAGAFCSGPTHVKVLGCHFLATSKARYRLMHTMSSVFPLCLLGAAVFRTIYQGVVAVDVYVVKQVASLDLFVASLGLVRTLDNEVIQDVEQELRSGPRADQSSRTATGWTVARILIPAGCTVQTVATEVVVTVGDNDRVDKGAPTDGAHEVAVVC
jgi:hypothetical protein